MRSFYYVLKKVSPVFNYSQKMTEIFGIFLPEMAVRMKLVFSNRPTKTTWTGGISVTVVVLAVVVVLMVDYQ